MPQLTVLRPFDERYLNDHLRLHPVRPQLRQPLRSRERRLGNLDAVESRAQLEQQLGVESRADLAGVDEVVSIIVPDEQRAERSEERRVGKEWRSWWGAEAEEDR